MNAETIIIVLLVWTVAGLFVAIAFGKVIQDTDASPDQEEPLPSSLGALKYMRRNKRKASTHTESNTPARHSGIKRATG